MNEAVESCLMNGTQRKRHRKGQNHAAGQLLQIAAVHFRIHQQAPHPHAAQRPHGAGDEVERGVGRIVVIVENRAVNDWAVIRCAWMAS